MYTTYFIAPSTDDKTQNPTIYTRNDEILNHKDIASFENLIPSTSAIPKKSSISSVVKCSYCHKEYDGNHFCAICNKPCHPWHGIACEEKYAGKVVCFRCKPPKKPDGKSCQKSFFRSC